jgi:cell wall assembly regulator SMI1
MHPVTSAWARIDRWLAEHAPMTLALLNPPAGPHRVDAAQAKLGMHFPEDLAASLACHDGARYSDETHSLIRIQPPFHRPQSVDDIVRTWRGWMNVLAELEPQHGDMSAWLNRARV